MRHISNPSTGSLRQEDSPKFQAILGFIASSATLRYKRLVLNINAYQLREMAQSARALAVVLA